jgi:hypothetical protein
MPKLDSTHTASRLQKRITQLEANEEVAAKDIKAVLDISQQHQLEQAWDAQRKIRKLVNTRDEAAKKLAGWKTKREVQIEVLKEALERAEGALVDDLEELMHKKEVRSSKIYMDNFFAALDKVKSTEQAKSEANAALKRSHLRRMDGAEFSVGSARDRSVREMEEALIAQIRKNMTPEQFEQQQMIDDLERNKRKNHEKR